MAKQQLAEEPHRVNKGKTYYNIIVEVGQYATTAHPICHWSPWTTDNIATMMVKDTIGIITMIGGHNTTTGQRQIT